MLIDTHCHLNFKAFKKTIDQVLWQASEAGVEKIIVPGADLESSQKAVNLAQHFVNLYAAVGIHPHHAMEVETKRAEAELRKLAGDKKVVAIGECGLDYYQYPKTKYKNYTINDGFKKKQKEILKMQIKLALELDLPLIFHNRLAFEDIQRVVNFWLKKNSLKGVFHCFSGDKKFLQWAIDSGFYIGFDGNVTYNQSDYTSVTAKYNEELMKAVKATPLNRILLETDSPWLTPEPLRSKKIFPNKPENVKIIAQFIAELKGDSFLKVAKQTTANSRALFKF